MADEYDDIVSGLKQESLRTSLYAGARAQPDTEAKLQALSQRVGLPVDAIRRNQPEVELHDRLKSFDYEKVIKESPVLSAWLADPKNAAIAHDDWENLSRTERLLTYGRDYAGAAGQGVIGQGAGSTLSGLGELYGVASRSLGRGLGLVLPQGAMDVLNAPVLPWWLDPGQVLKRPGQTLKQAGNMMAPPKERQTLGTDVAAGIGQLGFQIGSFLLTGGASSTAQMFAQGADIMADKTAKDVADPALRDTAIVAGGAITALTEKYGLDAILNRVPPAIKNRVLRFMADKLAAGGIEAAQEAAEGLLHDIARRVLTNREAPILEGVEREMSAAALSAAIVRTALGVKGFRQAQQTEDFINALGEDAKASKLRERLPERYQALVEQYTANGPVQQVMVPAERFVEYFQGVGMDPAQAAAEFGAVNFAEAVAAGSDIVIPMGSFQANLAPTDHLQGLMPDLRLAPDEMTIREAREAEAGRAETEQKLREEIAQINEAAKSDEQLDAAIRRVVTDVEGQLQARYDAKTAREMATVMRGLAVMATRANPDQSPLQAAEALWARYGLTIRANPLPNVLTQAPDYTVQIDALLDRLRAGDMPAEAEAMGQSLYEFIRDAGGLKETGETRDLDQNVERKPGQRKMVQADGMDLDTALQRAIEAGYFTGVSDPSQLTETDLLEALGDDMRGNRRYSPQNENLAVLGTLRQLQALDEYIAEVGGDLATMDNAAIKALIVPREVEAEFDQRTDDDKRGSIQIAPDRKMRINLFEKANLSTFLHETGHFYLEVMGDLAEAEGTSQQVKDDYARILKFLGVEKRSQIKTVHHEKWARANEAYLMEGKAPTPELRGVFQRFSAWLKLVYRQMTALDVTLTDEVRGVMDRIYATDAEIARASQEAQIMHLLTDAKTAGMSEAEFALYRNAVAETTVEAKDALQRKLMRIEKLKREAWWKEERAKVAEEVAAEFDAQPRAQAFQRLSLIAGGERLNRAQLVERYGEPVLKRLPRASEKGRGAVYAEDGQDIDAMAEVMGFDTADAMIEALANMPNRARYIAAESDARMMERHGDLLNSVELADAAMEALHNEQREKVLRMELRALNRKIREVEPFVRAERDKARQQRRDAVAATDLPPVESFRAIARGVIGQKQVRDLSPNLYLVAERKASRAAFEAMARGDYAEAQAAKQRELLNHYMYLEATRAKAEADGIVKYLKGFDQTSTRQRLGKAGADYLDQIDALLERYEFRRVTQRELGRRESLAAWLAQQEAAGNAVAVPLELQDEARRVNWQQVPMDELRALRDSVKNIAHLASLKGKLMRKRQAIDFDKVVAEMLVALDSSGFDSTGDLGRTNMKAAGVAEKGAALWRKFDAAHLKVEQLVEWLDGGKIDGPWARYLFDLADEAQSTEYDLHAQVTQKIEALSSSMPKAWRQGLMDRTAVRLPGFTQPMTRYDLISIALNMGNAQNLQRLQDGYGWSDADLQRVRDALTAEDWRFVQGTWDAIETLWPYMAALEERTSGLPPEKVEAQEFEAAGQTWRGGYFPLVYDPRKSNAGERQANEAESVQNFMAQGYGRAATNRGATKARVEKLKAPVLLDYEQVVTSHLAKVIKDISHREAVIGINKILTEESIKAGLIDKVGAAQYEELRKWLQVLVNDRSDTLHQASGLGGLVMKARTNMAIVTMGWKISTMLAQVAGLGPSLDTVKPRFFGKALIEATASPRETWAFIAEKSGEMRNRANTIERDARDALLRMRGEGGVLADVRRTAFYLTAMADRMVSTPTWLGAYQQALAEGKSEEDAIRAGDRAVRLSQGAGGSKDLAAVQRNNELMKLLTMYYTPFNVLYARLRDVGHQGAVEGIGYLPKAAARLIALVVLPAVMGDLLAGRGPDEDEDETWWAIRKILLYPIATIPVVRDLSGFLEAGIIRASGEGEMKYPPSYKLSPVMSAIEKVAKLPGKIADAVTGEREVGDVAWDVLETSGYILGLPTAQARITGEYLVDLLTGEAEPENAAQLLRDAVFKRQE